VTTAASLAGVRIEVIRGRESLATWRGAWQELFAASGSQPSTSFEWTSALARNHLDAGDRFVLLAATRAQRLVALLPLVARSHRVLSRELVVLSPLSEQYNTHSDILSRGLDVETADALIAAICDLDLRWDLFRMTKLLEDSPATAPVLNAFRRRYGSVALRDGLPAYYLALPETYSTFLAQRSSKFRNHLRRIERKLAGLGTVRVVDAREMASFDAAYQTLLRVERASWKHRHGTAISAVKRQTDFYEQMGRDAFAAGRLHLQFLFVDDRPLAHNFGYVRDGCYYYLKTTYDETYRHVSPATVLRGRLIESLIADGIAMFDLPGEPYEWERQWTDQVRWHSVLTVYNHTLVGRTMALVDRWRHRRPVTRQIEHVDPRSQRGSP
jgi:CelD/BcsL family acetyltransferase involved in cellulose biosynthesis